jgi:hypothetical protein
VSNVLTTAYHGSFERRTHFDIDLYKQLDS